MTGILKNKIILVGIMLLVFTIPLSACSDLSSTDPLSTTSEATSEGTAEGTSETTVETTLSADDAHEERLRENVTAWGLGKRLIDYVGNNRTYDWDMTYSGGEPMGKDRYYDAESLMHSIELWYPYAVVITP